MSTTSIRTSRQEPRQEPPRSSGSQEFEVRWRNPERALVDYVSALWVRRVWIVMAAGLAMMIATLFALTQPNVYSSSASVLVGGNRSGANAAEMAVNMLRLGSVGQSQVMSALEVVNSHEVALRVVTNLGPQEILRPYQPRPIADPERERMGFVDMVTDAMHLLQASWFQSGSDPSKARADVAVEVFRRHFVAWADERASMLKLHYRAGSPELAQRILDEAVKVSIERYRQVTAPAEMRERIRSRTEGMQEAFDQAKSAYDAFIAEHGRVRFAEEIQSRTRSLSGNEAGHDAKARELESARKALATFSSKLAQLRDRIEQTVAVTASPGELLSQLRIRKFDIEQRKIDAEAKKSPEALKNDSDYKILVASLEHADRQIEAVQRPQMQTIVVENPEYRVLDERIRQLTLSQTQLESELPGIAADIASEREDLAKYYALQDQADRIVERYTLAKAEIERWKALTDTAEFSAQLDSLGLSGLQPVDPPTIPVEKEGPQRGRLILLGLAAGLLGALTWILVQVRMSRAFLRTSEVVVALGRSDVVGMPWLDRSNVERYHTARKRGWD